MNDSVMNDKEILTVDCRGLACPQPVVNTRRALLNNPGHPVLVIVDNTTARENVTLLARNQGYEVQSAEKEGNYYLYLQPAASTEPPAKAAADTPVTPVSFSSSAAGSTADKIASPSSPAAASTGVAYLITTASIGQGSPDLGSVLMKSFLTTVKELEPPPRALFLLNTGVTLAVSGSPVLDLLHELASRGTNILVCGTCLDYYKMKDRLAVGRVSNMLEIIGLAQNGPTITIA